MWQTPEASADLVDFPLEQSQRLAPPRRGEPPPRCLTPWRETHTLISQYSIVIPPKGGYRDSSRQGL
jgi:hypothetical protein